MVMSTNTTKNPTTPPLLIIKPFPVGSVPSVRTAVIQPNKQI